MGYTKLNLIYTDKTGRKHRLTLHRMLADRIWQRAYWHHKSECR